MGEYIERKEVLALIQDSREVVSDPTEELKYIRADVRKIPAADVRPVVRGRWISEDDGKTVVRMKNGDPQNSCKCSVCGEWLVSSDEYYVKGNFCPNCGADMMEES